MREELEKSIKTKRFISLTKEERKELSELGVSEEDFYMLKSFYTQLDENTNRMEVNQEVKKSLDNLFETTYPKETQSKLNKMVHFLFPRDKTWLMRPVIQLASVLFLLTLGITVFNTNKSFDRNLSQYTPKEIKEIKELEQELTPAIEIEEKTMEKESVKKQRSVPDSRLNETENIVDKLQTVENINLSRQALEKEKSQIVEDAIENKAELSSSDAQTLNNPLISNGGFQFLNLSTAYNSPSISYDYSASSTQSLDTKTSALEMESIATAESVNITQNASYNNFAVLDLLTPLF